MVVKYTFLKNCRVKFSNPTIDYYVYKKIFHYSPENLSSGQRIMLKLIKVALNLKLPLFYDLKKSGNFKF